MYTTVLKRMIDFSVSSLGLIFLFPVFIVVSIMLLINNHGSVFFLQKRLGKNEKAFNIMKFKTMNDKKDSQGNLLSDDKRLTPLGKFIRKTSLDELPQLINVLKGDMSLIGPRPFLAEYKNIYTTDQKRRHLIRPGITGWAQVNGRNNLLWKQKFELDIWYVDNISFFLDVKIFFLTLYKVLKGSGISKKGEVVVEKFNGKN